MDIFVILKLLGGVALFIYGMHQMGDGLQKAAGSQLEKLLERMTRGKMRGVLLGIIITAIMQSSSTTTVMVVGFVNSGIMKLSQTVPVIMGANIGTTITSWILSLTGIESNALLAQLIKPATFVPVLALVGVAMVMFSGSTKKRNIGNILAGFALLMFGMDMMTAAVKPLASDPNFANVLLIFNNPWLGMLVGAVLTGIIQSSAASIGMLQALTVTGTVTYGMALPIIMGQNIGTCVTALLSSIGTNKAARRTAMVHLYFNLIGSLFFMVLFVIFGRYLPFFEQAAGLTGIAVIHTVFNVTTTGLLLPFTGMLEKLALLTVKDRAAGDKKEVMLDERLLATPAFALARCRVLVAQMADIARGAVLEGISLFKQFDEPVAKKVADAETEVDHYEDILGTFSVKLTKLSLSDAEGRDVTRILHGIGDFERISDHALNLSEGAREIHEKGIRFTDAAQAELGVLYLAVERILSIATDAYNRADVALAKRVEPLEEVIDILGRELKSRHVKRLRAGRCTVESGFVFADLLNNLERVADHCSNLAVCVIELSNDEFNAHEYIENLETMEEYAVMLKEASREFALPAES